MARLWKPDGNHVDTVEIAPKAELEKWTRQVNDKIRALEAKPLTFDRGRELTRLRAERDEYLDELMVWVLRGEVGV